MNFHLVTYATPKYRHRQIFLAASARANGIVSSATSWTPARLAKSGFPEIAPDISLSERGSGFWAWKPFIIDQAMKSLPDGEIIFYCDVGRKYPYILIDRPLDAYAEWMNEHGQDIMPGINIPWNGSMSIWTKRDAFIGTGINGPKVQSASPIQASFSFWLTSPNSRAFVREWLEFCVQRHLVSDDPSESGKEAQEFRGHRHDQSLLTLCCIKHGIQGLDLGPNSPTFNERDPGQVAGHLFGIKRHSLAIGHLIALLAIPLQSLEKALRNKLTLGQKYE